MDNVVFRGVTAPVVEEVRLRSNERICPLLNRIATMATVRKNTREARTAVITSRENIALTAEVALAKPGMAASGTGVAW